MLYWYTKQLRKKEWREFRRVILELDGGLCRRCGASNLLHVHHKYYLSRRKPWEYLPDAVETLCAGCHGREHGILNSLPGKGWVFVAETDPGDVSGECELCGEPIRYEFLVTNPQWGELVVGTVCCDRLTETIEASERFREAMARRKFVVSPLWKPIRDGVRRRVRGFSIRIYQRGNRFALSVNGVTAKRVWNSDIELKAKLFHWLKPGAELDRRFGRLDERTK